MTSCLLGRRCSMRLVLYHCNIITMDEIGVIPFVTMDEIGVIPL
jgi:hypothetical protein